MRKPLVYLVGMFTLLLTPTLFAQSQGYAGSIDVVKGVSLFTVGGLAVQGTGIDGYGVTLDSAVGLSERFALISNVGVLNFDSETCFLGSCQSNSSTTTLAGVGGLLVLRPSVVRDSEGSLADRQFGVGLVAQALSIDSDLFSTVLFSGGLIADIPLGGYISLRPNYMIFAGDDAAADGNFGGDIVLRMSPGSTSDFSVGTLIQQGQQDDVKTYQLKYTKRFVRK